MWNTILLIVTALISGLIATIVTIWWQSKWQKKNEKVRVFEILMSKRYEISAEESVEALNRTDVIFYDCDKVREAFKEFKREANSSEFPRNSQLIYDKYLKLLERMAENIGYKEIRWDDIKDYYFPTGLSNRKQDEAILRKAQIDVAFAQIKNTNEDKNISQTNKKDEITNRLMFELIDNPDKMLKLMEVAEKAQKLNK